ncbi:hypothetical protein JYT48_02450 [Mariprofundus ferrooxydans]|nr:hypothetical protein [Mariprofundus ferrooxydans]
MILDIDRLAEEKGFTLTLAMDEFQQIAMLQSLALNPIQSPYSQAYLSRINLSNGSMQRVIPFLFDHDLIYVDESKRYRLIDPCLEQYLISLSI